MTVYSHSRLSCYEQCPAKFKMQYLDKLETEAEDTVEAYLGSRVHETLEKLYRDLDYQKMNTLEDLLCFLRSEWEKNWSDTIVIVKDEYTAENYLKMAEKYITDYYQHYHPFDQGKTIALEQRIVINLDDEGDFKLQGFIDRLTGLADGCYEIHDYKTNSRLPLAEYIASDRQLALYMIGVKNQYPDVKKVRLIWHFLKFDKEIDSTRSDEELLQLKRDTISLIEKIEQEKHFPTKPSVLCEWCEFKPHCPQWVHLVMIQEKPAQEYMSDSGVMLVNQYAELKMKQKQVNDELEDEIEKLEQALLLFAEGQKVDCVYGSKNKVRVTNQEKYVFPSKNSKERKKLEEILQTYGKLTDVMQLDTTVLGKILLEKQWAPEMIARVQKYGTLEQKKRLYLSKLKDTS